MIDISITYYERIEKGTKGQRLSLKTAYKLATLLQINLNELYDLEEQYLREILHD
jgi:DNA-binding XRE family transcriptional regulator